MATGYLGRQTWGRAGGRTPQPPSLQLGKVKPQTDPSRQSPGWAARVAGAEGTL